MHLLRTWLLIREGLREGVDFLALNPPPFVLIGKKILFYTHIRHSKIYNTNKIVFTNKIFKEMLNIFCNLCQLLISSCPLKSRFFTPTLLRDVMISGSNDDHVSYLQAPEKYSWFHIKGSWSGRKGGYGGYKGGGAPSHPLPWDYEAINVPNLVNRM